MDPLEQLQALLDDEYCDYCTELDLEIKQRTQALRSAQRYCQLQEENARLTTELQQLRTELQRPTDNRPVPSNDKALLRAAARAVQDQLVLEGQLNGLAAVHEWLIQEVTAARQLVFTQSQAKLAEVVRLEHLLAQTQQEVAAVTAQISQDVDKTEHLRLIKQTEGLRQKLRKTAATRDRLRPQAARLRKLAYGKNMLK